MCKAIGLLTLELSHPCAFSFKAEVLSSDDLDSAEDQKDSQMVFKQIEHVDNFIGLDPNTNLEVCECNEGLIHEIIVEKE